MKHLTRPVPKSQSRPISAAFKAVGGMLLMVSIATTAHAQGEVASGIITSAGSGPYTYDLSFTDAATATSPIGSLWYAWVPGAFFLPGTPTSATAPSGWTASVSGNSIQFIARSSANYIGIGQTLSGFSYQATFSPAQLAAAENSGESVAYSGGLRSDVGNTFVVKPGQVPEPLASTLLPVGALCLLFSRRTQLLTETKP